MASSESLINFLSAAETIFSGMPPHIECAFFHRDKKEVYLTPPLTRESYLSLRNNQQVDSYSVKSGGRHPRRFLSGEYLFVSNRADLLAHNLTDEDIKRISLLVNDPDLHSEVDMLDIASGASFIRKEPAITRRLTFEHDTDICSLTENVKRLLESSSKQEALRIIIDVHPAENT
ncbi:MAG: hypothetical protein GY774_23380 [Planctomycetes bacterium]|nr:hypothetical protein [Planctomycetota bacterium]